MKQSIALSTGRECQLINIDNNLIPFYFVLAFPIRQGQPTAEEVTEMLNFGIAKAKKLSYEFVGDEEAYSLLYSGYSSRRDKGWHVHIVLLHSRWKKAWMYFVLSAKNLLQAVKLRKDTAPKFQKGKKA